ncbi:3'-5' exonuclease [Crenobacter cavernae]|uniref:3'-5' exoribonuclease n=1 Tax=Crenobacter cavernae TaxID=2290923 RepID=A0A345Y6U1_9NEIS|nr:3'-5' exonuclease [Crenobacter cavernae]AXK39643.1 3'-5' exoribonuclease [Crenobacter cavernae]
MITDNTLLISIDLETLGQQVPRAAIATIGMAAFELDAPAEPVATCYSRIERESALQVGKADQATLEWWAKQPAEARAEIEGGDTPLRPALMSLHEAIDGITAGRDPNEVIVVARAASFDCAIMTYHYDHFGMPRPWRYWQERDHRSLEDGYRDALARLGQDSPSYRDTAPVAHHALKDAISQAQYLITLRALLHETAREQAARHRFITDCLDPERHGYAVGPWVRDDARQLLGMARVETITKGVTA